MTRDDKRRSSPEETSIREAITLLPSPMRLDYTVTAGGHLASYLKGFSEGKIVGSRCAECQKVYLPSRGACPTCGIPTRDPVQVADRGTITTFCVIAIPFEGAPFAPPYVLAAIILDGADIPIYHLIRGLKTDEVRMGMRVKALWRPPEERGPTLESILWFEATGEEDANYESYAEHL